MPTLCDEPLDAGERGVGDLAPSIVDRQRVTPVLDLRDLRDPDIVLLCLLNPCKYSVIL